MEDIAKQATRERHFKNEETKVDLKNEVRVDEDVEPEAVALAAAADDMSNNNESYNCVGFESFDEQDFETNSRKIEGYRTSRPQCVV